MSSATDDLLAFKDYDDIAVNQPKKVIDDGKKNISIFVVTFLLTIFTTYRSIVHIPKTLNVSN